MKTRTEYSMITEEEEHDYQFSSKRRAQQSSRLLTTTTHRTHQIILTTTYRDLIPRVCWAVVLKMGWKHGKLVTL